jgi:hypothetical protein
MPQGILVFKLISKLLNQGKSKGLKKFYYSKTKLISSQIRVGLEN